MGEGKALKELFRFLRVKFSGSHQLVSEQFRPMAKVVEMRKFYEDLEKILTSMGINFRGTFPIFSGENPVAWIAEMEFRLDKYKIPVEFWFSVALEWLRIWGEWPDVKEMVIQKFNDAVEEQVEGREMKKIGPEKEVKIESKNGEKRAEEEEENFVDKNNEMEEKVTGTEEEKIGTEWSNDDLVVVSSVVELVEEKQIQIETDLVLQGEKKIGKEIAAIKEKKRPLASEQPEAEEPAKI